MKKRSLWMRTCSQVKIWKIWRSWTRSWTHWHWKIEGRGEAAVRPNDVFRGTVRWMSWAQQTKRPDVWMVFIFRDSSNKAWLSHDITDRFPPCPHVLWAHLSDLLHPSHCCSLISCKRQFGCCCCYVVYFCCTTLIKRLKLLFKF